MLPRRIANLAMTKGFISCDGGERGGEVGVCIVMERAISAVLDSCIGQTPIDDGGPDPDLVSEGTLFPLLPSEG